MQRAATAHAGHDVGAECAGGSPTIGPGAQRSAGASARQRGQQLRGGRGVDDDTGAVIVATGDVFAAIFGR